MGRANLACLDQKAKVGGIFNFMIRSDLAGQGYAQGAVQALQELGFSQLGLAALYLYTQATNETALHIYEKFGFYPSGSHYDYMEGQGYVKLIDLVAWAKD